MSLRFEGARLNFFTVTTIVARDALTKFEFMVVNVTDDDATYKLRADLVTWDEISQNSNAILAQQIFS